MPHDARDAGSVSVEFALALPSVVLVLALALGAGAWVLDVEAAQRGASEAARAAIVMSDADAAAVGARVAGRAVTMSREGGWVSACVTVTREPWPEATRCATARAQP